MGASAPVVSDNAGLIIFRKPVAGASAPTLTRFSARARQAVGLRGGVTVLVTGNPEVRSLNRRFRHQDHATDVLSFPADPVGADDFVGDIAISADIATRNAARLGHRPADELKILVLHGILHLAGYDHERDHGEMARIEARLRRQFHLPESLIERASTATPETSARRNTDNGQRTADKRERSDLKGLGLKRAVSAAGKKKGASVPEGRSAKRETRNGGSQ